MEEEAERGRRIELEEVGDLLEEGEVLCVVLVIVGLGGELEEDGVEFDDNVCELEHHVGDQELVVRRGVIVLVGEEKVLRVLQHVVGDVGDYVVGGNHRREEGAFAVIGMQNHTDTHVF